MRRALFIATSLVVTVVAVSGAHDFWIVPDAFTVAAGGRVAARGQTSSLFPTSVSAVTTDRIVEARVLTSDGETPVREAMVSGPTLMLGYRPAVEGQHLIVVRLAPRNVRESPASFRRYLDLEGALEARQRYEREGLLPPIGGDSITRRYAKYAKTFVEVGKGPRAFARAAGHPLELMPLSDPATLRAGDTLRVRLLMLGRPAAFARLHAGSVVAGAAALTDTAAARRDAAADLSIETDDAGIATIPVTRAGLWNVRTIQIVPANRGSGADWDVHWATITFAATRR